MYYTQKKPIENAHIVRERDRRRFHELSSVLFLAVPVGVFLLVFTCQNVEVIRLGREATSLQKQRKAIEDSNKSLQLELDRLTSLDSVEQKATALGFEPTDPRAIVMVTTSGPTAGPTAGPTGGPTAGPTGAPAASPSVPPQPPPAARPGVAR